MITHDRFRRLERLLVEAGYRPMIVWSEQIEAAADADQFAERAIYVICNSGMRFTVAGPIFERCMGQLRSGGLARRVFRHPGKGPAIDEIWERRAQLFEEYGRAEAKLDFLETLPWIGPVTKLHLAKNLGHDTAKPDVHLERLARREGTTTKELCRRLAGETGYKVATIDSILWRACADGILDSRRYELEGWDAALVTAREVTVRS